MNLIILLEEWQQWEADIIADNNCWGGDGMASYPIINGKHWERFLELQIKRKDAISYLRRPDPTCGKCQKSLSRCRCAY